MPADPRMFQMLSYYEDAELHGASLLLRLLVRDVTAPSQPHLVSDTDPA